jgi:hypothetical protein
LRQTDGAPRMRNVRCTGSSSRLALTGTPRATEATAGMRRLHALVHVLVDLQQTETDAQSNFCRPSINRDAELAAEIGEISQCLSETVQIAVVVLVTRIAVDNHADRSDLVELAHARLKRMPGISTCTLVAPAILLRHGSLLSYGVGAYERQGCRET